MSDVGQRERPVQDRVVLLFTGRLGYRYLGNRLDGEGKEYGYIVDYKDLFNSLEGAAADYTGEALEGYDEEDVAGLLKNRLQEGRERLLAGQQVQGEGGFSAVHEELGQYATRADEIFEINKSQREY